MTSIFEWYEDLLSKTDDSDFNSGSIPDTETFNVKIHEENNILAEWDLTNDLRDDGMAFRNYTNTSLNVNVELLLMHEDLIEKYKDDESLLNILEISANHSLNSTSSTSSNPGNTLIFTVIGSACFAFVVGLIGLIIKARDNSLTRVVKITRVSGSLTCLLIAIFTIVEELMKYHDYFDAIKNLRRFFSVDLVSVVIGGSANCSLKALMISWKVFSVIIYVFQNVMLYHPFFFREHKKMLGRWFIRVSLFQSVTIFAGSLIWVFFLILLTSDDCNDIVDRAQKWNRAFLGVGCFGYFGSLILSFIFLIGYLRQNFNKEVKRSRSEAKNIVKTVIACSIEILFDLGVLVTYLAGLAPCLSFKPYQSMRFNFSNQPDGKSRCDERFRWWALNSSLSNCATNILLLQPVIQEIFYLLSELVAFIRQRK